MGFEEETQFALIESEQEEFLYLQSIKTPELVFLVVTPFAAFKDYIFTLDENTQKQLELKSESDIQIYNIVKIGKDDKEIVVNLTAPLIFNVLNKKAKQYIINSSPYSMQQPLDKPLIVKKTG